MLSFAWVPHLLSLLWRAANLLVSEMGTTVLAVIVGVASFILPILFTLLAKHEQSRWDRLKASFKAVGIISIIWLILFFLAVAETVYQDHVTLVRERDYWRGEYTKLHAPLTVSLFYGDRELDGARIKLVRSSDPISKCTVMQTDANFPDRFLLCGIWMQKPDNEARYVSFYIDFSTDISGLPGNCQPTGEVGSGYRVAFRCDMWTPNISSATRWNLLWFYGRPTPTTDTRVRLRVPYGKNRETAAATFTLLPPSR